MKEKLLEYLLKLAHSCEVTLGKMIFCTMGIVMLAASVFAMPIIYIVALILGGTLAWIYRADLRR